MNSFALILAVLALAAFGFWMGRARARVLASGAHLSTLHSLPSYHGAYVALWCCVPALLLIAGWTAFEPSIVEYVVISNLPQAAELPTAQLGLLIADIRNLASGNIVSREVDPALTAAAEHYVSLQALSHASLVVLSLGLAIYGLYVARKSLSKEFRARNRVEKIVRVTMIVASTIAILTTVGIVLSLIFETLRFFDKVSISEFLFGLTWSPQTALRAGQVGSSGAFGAVPIFAGTFLITILAMTVAVPVGLFSAVYMSEYAGPKFRAVAKPILEMLAGIPTVVYGFFAALTVAPFFRNTGEAAGLVVSSESALAAGMVMGIMIIPFISSLSDDVMNAVPQTLRDGSYALGATKSETIKQVILPAALPGIVGAVLLAVSRAIGETMIVVMAAGLAANLTLNPLEAVTTVTVQIVTLLVGDQEFDSAKTLAAFALGLVLFMITLSLNMVAQRVVKKYREKYD
ncbi:MAG: phosphate ABC transporter permease subunit PstC [Alphaproteobacteria bacterium]|nr:phosphate ABC transporter permease subunit PstC [Rhodobiaceae bacterium]MBO6544369.1 phosphate ABC transporter permease subunit PstC [Alphaproteobacteria bacterium]MBO6629335.1 phosphate ABC transporter permease subunit PstC [Alphaproteobacteria bacterium]MDF1627398.1 phosphate ABC transporter permease subunit PstC [Parvibaculaceae bacterium]